MKPTASATMGLLGLGEGDCDDDIDCEGSKERVYWFLF